MSPTTRSLRLVLATGALQSLALAGLTGSVREGVRAVGEMRGGAFVPSDPALMVTTALQALAWTGVACCCLWFAAAVLACAHELARHPVRPVHHAARGCLRPAFVRSLLVVLVGGLLATPAPVPVADQGPRPTTPHGLDPGWRVLDGLPLPALPALPVLRALPTHRHPAERSGSRPPRTVEVHAGDCLWTVTAALLGPRATDAEVARSWPLLRSANREALGPDPDLVRPGTTLLVPPVLTHHRTVARPAGAPR